jgi:hypothetical protein
VYWLIGKGKEYAYDGSFFFQHLVIALSGVISHSARSEQTAFQGKKQILQSGDKEREKDPSLRRHIVDHLRSDPWLFEVGRRVDASYRKYPADVVDLEWHTGISFQENEKARTRITASQCRRRDRDCIFYSLFKTVADLGVI